MYGHHGDVDVGGDVAGRAAVEDGLEEATMFGYGEEQLYILGVDEFKHAFCNVDCALIIEFGMYGAEGFLQVFCAGQGHAAGNAIGVGDM